MFNFLKDRDERRRQKEIEKEEKRKFKEMFMFRMIINNEDLLKRVFCYRTERNFDGSDFEEDFLLGMHAKTGQFVNFFSKKYWSQFDFLKTRERAFPYKLEEATDKRILLRIMGEK